MSDFESQLRECTIQEPLPTNLPDHATLDILANEYGSVIKSLKELINIRAIAIMLPSDGVTVSDRRLCSCLLQSETQKQGGLRALQDEVLRDLLWLNLNEGFPYSPL